MDSLLSFEGALVAIVLLVPGFISIKVWSLIVPTSRRVFPESIMDVFAYGVLNLTLLFWPIQYAFRVRAWDFHPVLFSIAVAFYGFIFPSIWPIIWWQIRKVFSRKDFHRHLAPRAWDYFFGKHQPVWILVHLRNGNLVGGRYDKESFASCFPDPQELYIEEVWQIDGTGAFKERIQDSAGMWIDGSEIEYLEFLVNSDV